MIKYTKDLLNLKKQIDKSGLYLEDGYSKEHWCPILELTKFKDTKENAILNASEKTMTDFAREHLNYNRNKDLDFVARFNGKYIIGEAKFLTDFRGHQNAQFSDAISTLKAKRVKAIKIAILDGVLYIKGKNKMYKSITTIYSKYNIMSALVLREFLYQV